MAETIFVGKDRAPLEQTFKNYVASHAVNSGGDILMKVTPLASIHASKIAQGYEATGETHPFTIPKTLKGKEAAQEMMEITERFGDAQVLEITLSGFINLLKKS